MAMEQCMNQVRALTEELNVLKAELIQVKSAHATMHQTSVEAGAQAGAQSSRINAIEEKMFFKLISASTITSNSLVYIFLQRLTQS